MGNLLKTLGLSAAVLTTIISANTAYAQTYVTLVSSPGNITNTADSVKYVVPTNNVATITYASPPSAQLGLYINKICYQYNPLGPLGNGIYDIRTPLLGLQIAGPATLYLGNIQLPSSISASVITLEITPVTKTIIVGK